VRGSSLRLLATIRVLCVLTGETPAAAVIDRDTGVDANDTVTQ
jgi:hypothetical protein